MLKTRDKQVTEEKILNAALAEFGEFGLSGARVDRIAERAEVNKAMIYYYFNNKEELYERILRNTTGMIFAKLRERLSVSGDPVESLKSVVAGYMEVIDSIDRNVIKTILRELASGGEYFRRIAVPNLVFPMLTIVESLYANGFDQGRFRELNPYYTFFQLVGGILFFNMIKIPVEGTPLQEKLFGSNYLEEFMKNYFTIMFGGILNKEG